MKVAVLTYEHRYGFDNSVYLTKEAALKSAAEIIQEWYESELQNRDDLIVPIREALEAGRYEDAIQEYNESASEVMSDEWIVVAEHEVQE
jgi:hypothetical protein